jgi:hypothetical protein
MLMLLGNRNRMTFLCPKCDQTLDVGRAKLRVCSSCGSAVPSKIIIQQRGPAALIKEEADSVERRKIGKPLSSLQNLIVKLRTLEPEGAEFYSLAASHLLKQFRPNRTYGMFFIFLGSFPMLLLIPQDSDLMTKLLLVGGYLFSGALGLHLFYHSSATRKNLPDTFEGEDVSGRLQRLRKVALNNQQDPVAALVLELTEGGAR